MNRKTICYCPDIGILEATLQRPNKIKPVAMYLHYILLSGLWFDFIRFVFSTTLNEKYTFAHFF
jgi:hypothetical protein